MTQLIKFKKEPLYDFRSVEAKRKIKEINQETDGIERQGADCLTGLLFGNGEEADHDSMESSL